MPSIRLAASPAHICSAASSRATRPFGAVLRGRAPRRGGQASKSTVTVVADRVGLAGEHEATLDLVVVEGVVAPHVDLAGGDLGPAGAADAALAGERQVVAGGGGAVEDRLRPLRHRRGGRAAVEDDGDLADLALDDGVLTLAARAAARRRRTARSAPCPWPRRARRAPRGRRRSGRTGRTARRGRRPSTRHQRGEQPAQPVGVEAARRRARRRVARGRARARGRAARRSGSSGRRAPRRTSPSRWCGCRRAASPGASGLASTEAGDREHRRDPRARGDAEVAAAGRRVGPEAARRRSAPRRCRRRTARAPATRRTARRGSRARRRAAARPAGAQIE